MIRGRYYIGNVMVDGDDTTVNGSKYRIKTVGEPTEYKLPTTMKSFQNVILGQTIEESCKEAADEYYDD